MGEPQTLFDKIWKGHVVAQREGHPAVFAIDLVLLHEVTSAQAFDELRRRKLPVWDIGRCVATLDHSIPTRKNRFEIFDDQARFQVESLRTNCRDFGVPLMDFDSGMQGIVHVIGPELGLTQPGITVVCGDSHTSTHGAFGALAFGVGTSELGHVLASGCLLQRRPKQMRVNFSGQLRPGVYSKDMILALIGAIGVGGGQGYVIEYAGEAVEALSMEQRMTICNMSIECGARAGLIAPDDVTFEYLKGRPRVPSGDAWEWAVSGWRALRTDGGATFDKEVTINVSKLEPMVTWGTNPGQTIPISSALPVPDDLPETSRKAAVDALSYTRLNAGAPIAGTPVSWAFLGSCTNGRIEDLRIAAGVIKGKRIHPSVTMYVVPGSEAVLKQAQEEGLVEIFRAAGADVRMPGCSMCLGMNDDLVPQGERCISSSNRNFVGRQGPGSITHLASPATVAASAIRGAITAPSDV